MNNSNDSQEQTINENTIETAPTESVDTPTEQKSTAPQESWKEVNLKLKRQEEEMYRLRLENDYLQDLKVKKEQSVEEEFDINKLPDDDLLSAGHLKYQGKKSAKKIQLLEDRLIISEMRDRYDDFKKVVNTDTMKKLGEQDPLYAKAILSNSSKEEQLEMAYSAIKRYGIYKPQQSQEQESISEYNTSRPKPSNAVTSSKKSVLSEAGSWGNSTLTKEMKAEIYRKAREKASSWNS